MCNRRWKAAVCAVAGVILTTGMSSNVWALPAENALAGVSVTLESTSTNENDTGTADTQMAAAEGSLAAAQVNDYVNIRDSASEEGEILGKLYNGSVATILGQEGDWFQVTSGSVTGYIKREYLVYGDAAEEEIAAAKITTATVNTQTLYVREEPTAESRILDALAEGETVVVEETLEGWEKIVIEDQECYISTEYVTLEETYKEAESKEEEEARLAAEYANIRQELIDYAQQFVGNPYVWGGTSLTNGADCSGFVMSVYQHFGYDLPRTSREQAAGAEAISEEEMQPGDLLFYGGSSSINHVAIYIGDGQIVHASNARTGIKISDYHYRTPVKIVSYL